MNKIGVVSLSKQFQRFEKLIQKLARKVLKVLNKKFRGKNKTTSVLSFQEPRNFILPPSKQKKIGEIYLNLQFSNSQIPQLLIHGLLHLLGYNHQKKSDRIRMEKKEKLVISNFYFSRYS